MYGRLPRRPIQNREAVPVAVLAPRFAQTLRGAAPCQEGPPRVAAEVGARYARRDAERRARKAKAR